MQEMAGVHLDSERCNLLDLSEEICDEIESHFDEYLEVTYSMVRPLHREFALAEPERYQAEMLECRSFLKSAVKGVRKCSKKVAKRLKKGAVKVADFVKEHKTEILIGAAVVAAAAGVYYVSGALIASAAAADPSSGTDRKREDEEGLPCPDLAEIPHIKEIAATPETPAAPKTFMTTFLEGLQRGMSSLRANFSSQNVVPPDPTKAAPAPSAPTKSCIIETEGVKKPGVQIGFINGMNTSFPECKNHLEHVKRIAGDVRIEGVYNHSNGVAVDLAEIVVLNYAGIAPITADLLVEKWTQFHQENIHNPDAKYLQFTHSMGTIQTKDGLQRAPQEIRDRVIVVAIAPAVVIPRELCHDSFHYASKKDIVHYGEDAHTHFLAAFNDEPEQMDMLKQLSLNKEKIVFLDPHEDAKGIDHDFESPTFHKEIKQHIDEYLK